MTQLVALRRSRAAGNADRQRSEAEGVAGALVGRGAPGRTVYIETYGCQMNIGDTELMAGVLADAGYARVDDPGRADVILVNTCAIREHAENRVLGRLGQLQRYRDRHADLLIGVTGCMAQRLGEALLQGAYGVDLVAGPDAYRSIGWMVDGMRRGAVEKGQALLALDADEDYGGLRAIRGEGVSAWVTVQRGCDHRCTFCIVPYVRGPEKNRAFSEVVGEVEEAVAAGYSEVTLLGQTVNSYRSGDGDFADLLHAVARVPGLRRVRFTSPHPNDVTERLLETMASEPAVCPQLHLPVQSGSDRILKRMVRRYTRRDFLEKVDLARRIVPDIALSTDIIVGFSGEMEADFEATLSLLAAVRFDDAYLYKYSRRGGTPATRLPAADDVPAAVAQTRLERTIELQRGIQLSVNRAEVGAVREVLTERIARSAGDLLGRTARNKVVAFRGPADWIGTYRRVRLTATSGATFTGAVA
ncbi:MAG: tRNA (N6-isopentenyl adenosine(37)-C2)-methylthiotransferase MiaB [Gemmatimonadota bacterium]|nr:MAG: tRNA (N6-isopentenyl adenosine(37)-C2)-methylthiotransferase MiaB [Gemmatimonadota bacterium]